MAEAARLEEIPLFPVTDFVQYVARESGNSEDIKRIVRESPLSGAWPDDNTPRLLPGLFMPGYEVPSIIHLPMPAAVPTQRAPGDRLLPPLTSYSSVVAVLASLTAYDETLADIRGAIASAVHAACLTNGPSASAVELAVARQPACKMRVDLGAVIRLMATYLELSSGPPGAMHCVVFANGMIAFVRDSRLASVRDRAADGAMVFHAGWLPPDGLAIARTAITVLQERQMEEATHTVELYQKLSPCGSGIVMSHVRLDADVTFMFPVVHSEMLTYITNAVVTEELAQRLVVQCMKMDMVVRTPAAYIRAEPGRPAAVIFGPHYAPNLPQCPRCGDCRCEHNCFGHPIVMSWCVNDGVVTCRTCLHRDAGHRPTRLPSARAPNPASPAPAVSDAMVAILDDLRRADVPVALRAAVCHARILDRIRIAVAPAQTLYLLWQWNTTPTPLLRLRAKHVLQNITAYRASLGDLARVPDAPGLPIEQHAVACAFEIMELVLKLNAISDTATDPMGMIGEMLGMTHSGYSFLYMLTTYNNTPDNTYLLSLRRAVRVATAEGSLLCAVPAA